MPFDFGSRLPLLLVAFAIALASDALIQARDGFGLTSPKATEADASQGSTGEPDAVRVYRSINLILFLLFGAFIGTRHRPDAAFAATALWALLGPGLVQVGAAIRARRFADPAIPGPRLLDPAVPPTLGTLLSGPLQLLHASVVVVVCLFFRWTLPHLPSVAPLLRSADGNVYTSPTGLWWSLALIAFNTAMLLFAAFAARGPAAEAPEDEALPAETRQRLRVLDVQRRALSVRLVETLLVGLNLVALAMWVAAILALLPGQSPGVAPRGAMVAGGLAGATLLLSVGLYLPPIVRARRAQQAARAQPSPSAK